MVTKRKIQVSYFSFFALFAIRFLHVFVQCMFPTARNQCLLSQRISIERLLSNLMFLILHKVKLQTLSRNAWMLYRNLNKRLGILVSLMVSFLFYLWFANTFEYYWTLSFSAFRRKKHEVHEKFPVVQPVNMPELSLCCAWNEYSMCLFSYYLQRSFGTRL